MERARTRGQAAALVAVDAMVRGPAPHAVLLVGPDGVGKTTLALDLAAGLLCTADATERPCRACRACRLVEHGSHPDLHLLGPAGPGRQVVIGGPDAKYRGVKDLIGELQLMPVEGGARVAIIEAADRMNEDAQSALLKTLEEPPAGVTIILCADAEARLLPTVRSRCFRVRLGLVGPRDIEAIVADHGLADPPTAARLGRLAGGRPGLALAYARTPDAVLLRAELTRVLLDMTDAGAAVRLATARAAVPRAIALSVALSSDPTAGTTPVKARGRRAAAAATASAAAASLDQPAPATEPEPDEDPAADPDATLAGPARTPAVERRRGVEVLLGLWTDVARDLVLVAAGGARSVRDTVLLEELASIATTIDPTDAEAFLARAARSAEWLATNVSPELILDTLALAWPRRSVAAA
ncbi:MAG: AAA family ATPase [Chloroflexota bacterium]